MPKSKVTKLEQMPMLEGQQYPSFSIEFEDGTKGITKSKFVLSQEMDYIVEERQQKKDPSKTYSYITRPQVDKFQGARAGYKKDFIGKTISMTSSYAKDLYLTEYFREMKFSDIMDVICKKCTQKLDTLATEREKDFVPSAMSYAIHIYMNDWQRNKFRKSKGYSDDNIDTQKELELIYAIFNQLLKDMLDVNKSFNV